MKFPPGWLAAALLVAVWVPASAQPYSARQSGDVVQLEDTGHQTVVSIVPSVGNQAIEMKVKGHNVLRWTSASVADFKAKPGMAGVPLLAPWADILDEQAFYANGRRYAFDMELGNVRGARPGHGFLTTASQWQVTDLRADARSAWVTSTLDVFREPAWMQQFPFAHRITMTYRLQEGVLEVATAIENLSAEPMPVSIGFHPYVKLTDSTRDEWTISIPAKTHWLLAPTKLPTGETEPIERLFPDPQSAALKDYNLDDVFTDLVRDGQGRAHARITGKAQQLEILIGPNFRGLTVWAPSPSGTGLGSNAFSPNPPAVRQPSPPKPSADPDFICFEPLAAIVNGLNLAHKGLYKELQHIDPGGTWRESFWIRPSGFEVERPREGRRYDNWPQWRGPQLNGTAAETNLPTRWSKTEGVAWSLPLPAWSGSTPIVWGNRIFLNVADGLRVWLWCVNRANGAVVWKRQVAEGNRQIRKQNMSSPSPVTDGTHVWVMTGTGVLKAFDFDGKERWTRDVQADYGLFGQLYGYGSSPLLFENSIYVQVLHGSHTADPSYLLRLDKMTGQTRWRVERSSNARQESPDAYTTPTLVRDGTRAAIVVSGADVVTAHDPETGAEIWRAEGLNPTGDGIFRIIASPFVHDGIVYAPTRERPMLAVRAGGGGDVTRSHVLWRFMNGPDVPTPVTDGTYLYVVNDRGIMWCLDAKTGAPVYERQRLRPSTYTGSPVLADGKIYVTNEDGLTSVVRAGPKFEVLAENDLGEYTLSSPAVSDGQIFIRTDKALYAIGRRP